MQPQNQNNNQNNEPSATPVDTVPSMSPNPQAPKSQQQTHAEHTARLHKNPEPENEDEDESKDRREHIKSILSTIGIFLLAPLLAIFLTAFVFQSYEVDGVSMETTLQNQDRLIVYKLPKTIANLRNQDFIPARGEIIVFDRAGESEFTSGANKQLIKRVIGLPGDRVVVKKGKVTVYNQENPNGFNPDDETGHLDPGEKTEGNVDITVKEGEVFVLGDNRDNSLDSRVFGPIKAEAITGDLILRLYPLHEFQAF